MLLPTSQTPPLLLIQILQCINPPLLISQHVRIKTPLRQSSTRVSSCKTLVRTPGTVESLAGCDVVDFSGYSEEDLWFVGAVVGEEGEGGVFPIDDRYGAGDDWCSGGAEAEVANVDDEGEEDEVEWGDDWDPKYERLVGWRN